MYVNLNLESMTLISTNGHNSLTKLNMITNQILNSLHIMKNFFFMKIPDIKFLLE